ncbi:alpha/beta fold hydrolase [Bosea sp. 124]|uniref:alpha/beta fold hydrolase n=1 Tax=Bosea sp. 124 TaxID=2135642 RepID=UPI000D34F7FD|nr:alpha/beta fold hydrolase [Bosea sp. 124]PTM43426.1 pimeloyl-ACP methyl ester carboxylesterase [Bosea sp. 124]
MTTVEVSPDDILDRLDASAESIETPCGDGRMVWRVWGQGRPLVLLHGGYGSWRHWVRTIPHFQRSRRVFVPDTPGLGDSDEAPEATPAGIGAVVARGLEQIFPPQQKVDLVGFSFGALIAGHAAAQFPRDLASLTLVGAGALGIKRSNVELTRTDRAMPDAERREINRANLGLLMIADATRIDDLAITIQERNVGLARVKSRRFANSPSLAEALKHSRPDRLNAVWGAKDVVVNGYFAEREALLRQIRPDVTFNLVPDAGHWVAYEAPETFNRLLETLLG